MDETVNHVAKITHVLKITLFASMYGILTYVFLCYMTNVNIPYIDPMGLWIILENNSTVIHG